MAERTPLYPLHHAAGARLTDFAGWEMPLHYGSQLSEHLAVRRDCGLFDVSHMGVVEVAGGKALEFLRRVLANDVARLAPGRALYSPMLSPQGGILDDLIAYRLGPARFFLVVNCANTARDLQWLREQSAGTEVEVRLRRDLAILALQGPRALERLARAVDVAVADAAAALPSFGLWEAGGWVVARTGYTGEDGVELLLPADEAPGLWRALSEAGATLAGLAARDSLRIEAGLPLYGQEMDETVSPLRCGLAWTVAWEPEERRFVGREALEAERRAGPRERLAGLLLEGRGVLRAGQRVLFPTGEEGRITSGTYSPFLQCSIALARVPADAPEGRAEVEIRGRREPVRVVAPRFVRRGRILVETGCGRGRAPGGGDERNP
ncbi:MAG: aminomethyltransferase [Porticoccaceae bacterium]|nr:MAG: aminomethyltransferase [Porticoccaceae bacterium]